METTQIRKNDGTPYPSEKAAKAQAARKKLKFSNVISVDGGFAIEVPAIKPPEEVKSDSANVQSDDKSASVNEQEVPAKKKKGAISWKPSRKLDIPERFKNSNFDYYLANADKMGRVRQLITDGYEVDKEISRKMNEEFGHDRHDKQLDGTYRVNEHIVMRIPKEKAQEIRDYYSQQANGKEEEYENETRESLDKLGGVTSYIPREARKRASSRY